MGLKEGGDGEPLTASRGESYLAPFAAQFEIFTHNIVLCSLR